MKKISLIILLLLAAEAAAFSAPAEPPRDGEGRCILEDAGQLKWFRDAVNGGERELSAVLSADIDLGGQTWTPIGDTEQNAFNGTFDGAGHTIRGFSARGDGPLQGLFGCADYGSLISGLKLENASVVSASGGRPSAGIIAGETRGIIQDCSVTMSRVSVTAEEGAQVVYGGLIAGFNDEGVILGCSAERSVVSVRGAAQSGAAAGGICGVNVGTMPGVGLIMNCESRANEIIITVPNSLAYCYGGGIAGMSLGGVIRQSAVSGGKITGGGNADLGGIIGFAFRGVYIENCRAGGDLLLRASSETAESSVGGAAGNMMGSNIGGCVVKNVILSAEGEAGHKLGGVAGVISNGKISDCRVADLLLPPNATGTFNIGAVAGAALSLETEGAKTETAIENTFFHYTIAKGIAVGLSAPSLDSQAAPFDATVSADLLR